jgi:hypothetical protein
VRIVYQKNERLIEMLKENLIMSFNPKTLPPTVYDSYLKYGVLGWTIIVQFAIKEGVKDTNTLVNIVFYLHHPELDGRPIYKNEVKFIAEWKAFYTMIKALQKGMAQTTFEDPGTGSCLGGELSFKYSNLTTDPFSFNSISLYQRPFNP